MESIRLKNFRCFEDTGNISLKPLTFLVGANSSGKSSFLKFFPLLKQSVNHKRKGIFLWTDIHGIDFKSLSNVLRDKEKPLEVEMNFINIMFKNDLGRRIGKRKNTITVSFRIRRKDDFFDELETLTINLGKQNIKLSFNSGWVTRIQLNNSVIERDAKAKSYILPIIEGRLRAVTTVGLLPQLSLFKNEFRSEVLAESLFSWGREELSKLTLRQTVYPLASHRLFLEDFTESPEVVERRLSTILDSVKSPLPLNDLYLLVNLGTIIRTLNVHLGKISHLSYVTPLRAQAQRYYRIENLMADEIEADGSNLAMYLFNLPPEKFKDFQVWTNKLFGFHVKLEADEGHVQLNIVTENQPHGHNMVDVGFGYSQILPTIAIIWNAMFMDTFMEQDSILNASVRIVAIEQPELHLHPRFIKLFAEMLAQVVFYSEMCNLQLRIIIETHSETLINRIGELVANDEIGADTISVLLFNGKSEGMPNYIEEATFTSDGYLSNWPYGFFSGDEPYVYTD